MGGTVRGANYLSGAWNQVQSAGASRPTNAEMLNSLNRQRSQPGQVEADTNLRPLAAGQNNTASSGEAGAYTVERDDNGRVYVQINADILSGIPESKWKSTVRNVIQKIFGDGISLPRGTVFSNRTGRGEYTNGSYSRMLERTDPSMYSDKLRMSVGTDAMLQNAEMRYEDSKHQRNDDIVGFNRGNIIVSVKGNGYLGDILTAVYSDGKETFFDINNLRRENIKATSPERYTEQVGFTQTGDAAFNNSIPPVVKDVNGQPETVLGENGSNILYTKNNEDIHQLLSNGLQLPEALDEVWQGADGPSVRGPQEDGIQSRGATPVWEAAAVPNSSAGSGQRILEEGWRDEAPSVRGPEEDNLSFSLRKPISLDRANWGYGPGTEEGAFSEESQLPGRSGAKDFGSEAVPVKEGATFRTEIPEYTEAVNNSISRAGKYAVEQGAKRQGEYLILVDTRTGTWLYEEAGDEVSVGNTEAFRRFVREHPDGRFAYVHAHPSGRGLSLNDMAEFFGDDQFESMVAAGYNGKVYAVYGKRAKISAWQEIMRPSVDAALGEDLRRQLRDDTIDADYFKYELEHRRVQYLIDHYCSAWEAET